MAWTAVPMGMDFYETTADDQAASGKAYRE